MREKLNQKQLQAIALLLEGERPRDIAKQIKVARSTVYSWLNQEKFRTKLEELKTALFYESIENLKAGMKKASKKLVSLIDSQDENVARLSSIAILNFGFKSHELTEFEERLSRVEEIIEGRFLN